MKRVLRINPDHKPATWSQIREWRDAHELGPVTTTYGVFDADEKAEYRLTEAISEFESLPVLVGGKLGWKLADNTRVWLTKAELEDVHAQIRHGRATRASLLHFQAEEFAAMDPTPTPSQLKSLSFWLE